MNKPKLTNDQINEIIEKYLGEHEVKVEFTDRDNKTNTYKEKIIVE